MKRGIVIANFSDNNLTAYFLEGVETNYYVVTDEGIPIYVTTDPQELNDWWREAISQ